MTTHSLLAPFDALVLQHQALFKRRREQLRTTIETTLQQLQAQEQPLVAAQIQVLSDVRSHLATDARVLMGSIELDRFIAEVQALPRPEYWHENDQLVAVRSHSADWLLAQLDIPIRVFDYATTVDHDAYDDERTFSTYGYAVTVEVQNESKRLEVATRSVYSPINERTYNSRQILEYDLEEYAVEFVEALDLDAAIQGQLVAELSHLIGCAVQLFALIPQSVQFQVVNPAGSGATKGEGA